MPIRGLHQLSVVLEDKAVKRPAFVAASLLSFAVMITSGLAGCASKPEPSKTGPKKGAESTPPAAPPTETSTATTIGIERTEESALSFATGRPIALSFRLTNAEGKDVIVGLMTTPKGPTLTHADGTTDVTFNWATPAVGTHKVRFVLRDKARCEAAEADATRCAISTADFGVIGANDKYDAVSSEYELTVTQGTIPPTAGGTVDPAGNSAGGATGGLLGALGGLGGLSGGNADLIAKIKDLLGGGALGGGKLEGMLSGLGGGQLQSLLGMVQGGAVDSGNLAGIIQLLKGFALDEQEP